MKITIEPETYKEEPAAVSISMAEEMERRAMTAARAGELLQSIKRVIEALTQR